eukprot:403351927
MDNFSKSISTAHYSTVKDELVLSSQLLAKLENAYFEVSLLKEQIQTQNLRYLKLQKQFQPYKSQILFQQQKLKILTDQLKNILKDKQSTHMNSLSMNQSNGQLREVILTMQNKESQLSDLIFQQQKKLEQSESYGIEMKAENDIVKIQMGVLEDQVKSLFELLPILERLKRIELKTDQEYKQVFEQRREIEIEKKLVQDELNHLLQERQELIQSFNQFKTTNQNLLEEKITAIRLFKREMRRITDENSKLKIDYDICENTSNKLVKENQEMRQEVEKLRKRIIQLRKKRYVGGNINSNFCKNCKKEYADNENFNWSCRTHLGEWGGDIWWCCGKISQKAPGCKYQKHQSKEEAEEMEERRAVGKIFKKVKCISCKQSGHTEDECPKDPNIKTNTKNYAYELQRIEKLKSQEDHKIKNNILSTMNKLVMETLNPTHKDQQNYNHGEEDESDMEEFLSDDDSSSVDFKLSKQHPFNKGVLDFDDFNYQNFFSNTSRALLKSLLGNAFMKIKQREYKIKSGAQGSRRQSGNSSVFTSLESFSIQNVGGFQGQSNMSGWGLDHGFFNKGQLNHKKPLKNDQFTEIVEYKTLYKESQDTNLVKIDGYIQQQIKTQVMSKNSSRRGGLISRQRTMMNSESKSSMSVFRYQQDQSDTRRIQQFQRQISRAAYEIPMSQYQALNLQQISPPKNIGGIPSNQFEQTIGQNMTTLQIPNLVNVKSRTTRQQQQNQGWGSKLDSQDDYLLGTNNMTNQTLQTQNNEKLPLNEDFRMTKDEGDLNNLLIQTYGSNLNPNNNNQFNSTLQSNNQFNFTQQSLLKHQKTAGTQTPRSKVLIRTGMTPRGDSLQKQKQGNLNKQQNNAGKKFVRRVKKNAGNIDFNDSLSSGGESMLSTFSQILKKVKGKKDVKNQNNKEKIERNLPSTILKDTKSKSKDKTKNKEKTTKKREKSKNKEKTEKKSKNRQENSSTSKSKKNEKISNRYDSDQDFSSITQNKQKSKIQENNIQKNAFEKEKSIDLKNITSKRGRRNYNDLDEIKAL